MKNAEDIINSITEKSVLIMTLWGETNTYVLEKDEKTGNWGLRCIDDVHSDDSWYSWDIGDLDAVKEALREDCKDEIITFIAIKKEE